MTDESDAVLSRRPVTTKATDDDGHAERRQRDGEGMYRMTAILLERMGSISNCRVSRRFTAKASPAGGGFMLADQREARDGHAQEAVTVTGASRSSSTRRPRASRRDLTRRMATLPGVRDYWAILSEAPSVKMQRTTWRQRGGDADHVCGARHDRSELPDGRRHHSDYRGHRRLRQPLSYGLVWQRRTWYGREQREMVPGVYTQLISKPGGNR